jgi:hypothetical protein
MVHGGHSLPIRQMRRSGGCEEFFLFQTHDRLTPLRTVQTIFAGQFKPTGDERCFKDIFYGEYSGSPMLSMPETISLERLNRRTCQGSLMSSGRLTFSGVSPPRLTMRREESRQGIERSVEDAPGTHGEERKRGEGERLTRTPVKVSCRLAVFWRPTNIGCGVRASRAGYLFPRDDAIDEVGLDDLAADIPLAAGVAGERAVDHDEPGHAAPLPFG